MDAKYVIKHGRDYWTGDEWCGSQREARRYSFADILNGQCAAILGRPVRLALKKKASATCDWAKSAIIAAVDAEREAIAAAMDDEAKRMREAASTEAGIQDYMEAAVSSAEAAISEYWGRRVRSRSGSPAGS